MLHRPYPNRFLHRIEILVLQAQLAHHRQPRFDLVLAQVAQIEMHVVAIGTLECAALFELAENRLRHAIARPQLHAPQHRRRRRLAQIIVLQEAIAVLVQQPAAFGPRRLRNQNTREGQPGRMVLRHLHVFERRAGLVRQRHPVTGADIRVGREGKHAAASAGADNHRLGLDRANFPGPQFQRRPHPGWRHPPPAAASQKPRRNA